MKPILLDKQDPLFIQYNKYFLQVMYETIIFVYYI